MDKLEQEGISPTTFSERNQSMDQPSGRLSDGANISPDELTKRSSGKAFGVESLIYEHPLWRMLEMVPGALSWFAIILPILLSAIAPFAAATVMIIYTVTWLFRSVKLSFNLYRSSILVKKALNTDWEKMLSFNDHPEKIDYEIQRINDLQEKSGKDEKLKQEIQQLKVLKTSIEHLQKTGQYKKSREIIHAIIYVTYKESYELIRESIKSYANSKYNAQKMIFIFAGEASDKKNVLEISEKIKQEFGPKFMDFIVTIHPQNIPGEIKGKSSNATFAGKELKKYLDAQKIDYENVVVSNFDADTVIHPCYFTELTFKYLTADQRTEKGYQPTHMFHNNIWDVPMATRIVALSCTFWRMAESMEQDRYKSFSSRSIGFKTVVDVNYWDPSIIPEDSRQYWTAYTIYDGRHRLIPIYSPVYMDAVLSDTYIKTFKSQYNQLRRWAWGVCDFPFVAINLWYNKKIKFSQKVYLIVDFLKNSLLWATGPLLMSFMGFLPGSLNIAFRDTVLAYNLPHIMSQILTLASAGIVMCAIICLSLVPYNPKKGLWGTVLLCIQWLFVPIVSIVLSAVPALDAQTRLMFGKYLEYKVTQKARK